MMKRAVLAVAVLAAPILVSAPALAQMGGQNNAVSLRPKPEETLSAPRQAPPPALPGAQSQSGAAPATKLPTDMSPNDALFDAINRGDIAAARDSLNRGADLSARNMLGMSPMELSVDLGRNDISFLLLSMRGGSSGSAGNRGPEPSEAARSSLKLTTRKVPLVKTASRTERATPMLFANDGGLPVPDVGFLGFDGARATR